MNTTTTKDRGIIQRQRVTGSPTDEGINDAFRERSQDGGAIFVEKRSTES